MPLDEKIQLRRGTAAQWASVNPVLLAGEPGWDITNRELRVGDGATPWSGLTPVNQAAWQAAIATALAAEATARNSAISNAVGAEATVRANAVSAEAATRAAADAALTARQRPIIVRRTSGDLVLAVSGTFTDSDTTGTAAARTLDLVFPGAAVGDVITVEPNLYLPSAANATVHTFATIVGGAVAHRAAGAFGVPGWTAPAAGVGRIVGAYSYVVQPGDVEAGAVRVRMQHIIASAARSVKADTNTEFYLEGRGPFV